MRASCEARSVTVSYDHALNSDENHAAAKDALVKKMGYAAWDRHSTDPVMIGGTYGGDTYWVFDPNRGNRAQY